MPIQDEGSLYRPAAEYAEEMIRLRCIEVSDEYVVCAC
jgi:hypothetical protein